MKFAILGSNGDWVTGIKKEGEGAHRSYMFATTRSQAEAERIENVEEAHRLSAVFSRVGRCAFHVEPVDMFEPEPERKLGWRTVLLLTILAVIIGAFIASVAKGQNFPIPKSGQCPGGWAQSGGYCMPDRRSHICVKKEEGKQCPSGWRQSGGHCCKG